MSERRAAGRPPYPSVNTSLVENANSTKVSVPPWLRVRIETIANLSKSARGPQLSRFARLLGRRALPALVGADVLGRPQ